MIIDCEQVFPAYFGNYLQLSFSLFTYKPTVLEQMETQLIPSKKNVANQG